MYITVMSFFEARSNSSDSVSSERVVQVQKEVFTPDSTLRQVCLQLPLWKVLMYSSYEFVNHRRQNCEITSRDNNLFVMCRTYS